MIAAPPPKLPASTVQPADCSRLIPTGICAIIARCSWTAYETSVWLKFSHVAVLHHAAIGVAIGQSLALVLVLVDPSGIATLVGDGGSQGPAVIAGTLVLTFGIGASLTGVVFIMTEDD